MKKIQWVTSNKMLMESGHRTFDRQTNIIMPGNVFANTQTSTYIRAYNETSCNGLTSDPGHLQNYDLGMFRDIPPCVRSFIREQARDRSVILYRFFHHSGNYITVHGWVVTTANHDPLRFFVTGPTYKSYQVVEEAIKYVTN